MMRGSQRAASTLVTRMNRANATMNKTHNNTIRSATAVRTASTTFPRWPQAVHDATGDYRVEAAWLEPLFDDDSPLYRHQQHLPRLPVPTVPETLNRLVHSAAPLAESEEEASSFREAVAKFPRQAETIHARLLQRKDAYNASSSSWLQEWWNTVGYLQVRDSVVVNVSYFYHFRDDPTLGGTDGDDDDRDVRRGAAVLFAASEFRRQVCGGTRPAQTVGRNKTVLCSAAYKYMFHATRIPRPRSDVVRMYDPGLHRHCVVACQGFFFAVDCVSDDGDETPLPLAVLERRLRTVKERARRLEARHGADPHGITKLGWLTSMHRDSWATGREVLRDAGGLGEMDRALERLQSGAFLLCLDDEAPVSKNECANLFLHGNLTSGFNRWFDKSIQFICTSNGKAGLNGEHSMMDGMPTVQLADHVASTSYSDALARSNSQYGESGSSSSSDYDGDDGVEDIFACCRENLLQSKEVERVVKEARHQFDILTSSHKLRSFHFHGYGSNYMKSAGFSPDAYMQMAMQLATYRLFRKQGGTYEAIQVRPFLHGRTETARTVSVESAAFCRTMGLYAHDHVTNREKMESLEKAILQHVKYALDAAKGHGVDRHLFGLSMLCDGDAPDLFGNAVYQRAKRWRVSTSHLTNPHFENWGYGPVVEDGVGLSYGVYKDFSSFSVMALKKWGWSDTLPDLLEEALLEMKALIDAERSDAKEGVVTELISKL